MIILTMKCHDCKKEILKKLTNENYSEFLQKQKHAENQGIEYGWFCNSCADKKCVMCKIGRVVKFIPAKKDGQINKKIPACQSCFDRFRENLGFTEEITPELLEPLPNLTHEEWTGFLEKIRRVSSR